jgi:ankyrin repeat protein
VEQSADNQLLAAWTSSDEDAMIHALRKGADPDYRAHGVPLLIAACQAERIALVRELLDASASVNMPPTERNETALMFVVAGPRKRILEEIRDLLIERGADVNARDVDGNTALDWAIATAKTADADVLLANGATCRAASAIKLERLRGHGRGVDPGFPP